MFLKTLKSLSLLQYLVISSLLLSFTNLVNAQTVQDTIPAPGNVVNLCLDTTAFQGEIVSVIDLCVGNVRPYVAFELNEGSACLSYLGLQAGGTDRACIEVCDTLGFCDTINLVITTVEPNVLPSQDLRFTIPLGTTSSTDLDLNSFVVRPDDYQNICPAESGIVAVFDVNPTDFSVQMEALELGNSLACIELRNSVGSTQQFNISVEVVENTDPQQDTIRMRLGDTRFWCFDTTELLGPATSLENECEEANSKVTFAVQDDFTCASFRASEIGTQRICMRICDDSGFCDTQELIFEVLPLENDQLPIANTDYFLAASTGSVNPLLNDISASPILSARLVSGPSVGQANFDSDLVLNYNFSSTNCQDETIIYEICNAFGCDQSTIFLDNSCNGSEKPEIIQRSGFSPNGDGINDTWVLENIEFYPENTVSVFNRWGSKVLEINSYQNNWDGTFDNVLLPDGTYFFLAQLNEPGIGPVAGFLQLRR